MLAVTAGAAALRLADLGNRPMHCDEAVQADKFRLLLEDGFYKYDPEDYHGPSLNYLTLPIAWATSTQKLTEVTETHLRLLPAIFGVALVGLVWLIRDELGRPAAFVAAVLTAVSPAMVFYSRYYIQEMLLVGFTFGAMVALWRYTRAVSADVAAAPDRRGRRRLRQALCLVLFGLCVGMMHAAKETCVIPLFAMVLAAALTSGHFRRIGFRRILVSGLVALLSAAGISALFFSSFFDNPHGVVDSVTTYFVYLGRASGEGSVGRHDYPWHYYLRILFWWHRGSGPVWSEASVAVLALVGLVAGILGKGLNTARLPMVRFLSIYTVVMTLVYSALPYKTPWCALGFLHGMILLAGVGATVLVRAAPGYALKAAAVVAVVAATGDLVWQAHRASFVACEDPNNPYVYAHTTSDVLDLVERVREIAAVHPSGKDMSIQVICPGEDYWPLPWYLRDFTRVAPHGQMPDGNAARLIIIQPQLESALVNYLYVRQPPGQRHLYVPLPRSDKDPDWRLRPHVPLRMYVRLDLWEAYQAAREEGPAGQDSP